MNYPWQERQWREFFETSTGNFRLYTAADKDRPLGLLLYQLNPWSMQAHLLKIGLKPPARGSGAATDLLETSKLWLRQNGYQEVYLEVGLDNARALGFYRKSGFVELCVKRQFYSDGADALAMLLAL